MARLGMGSAFLRVTEALLSNTRARAYVNGAMSRAVGFQAGVRQGCPLAPLLYLFLGQALGRFLASTGIGISMEGEWLACTQYADDVTAFLPEEDSLPAFLAAMDVFGAATGQRLNPAKSKAMMMRSRTLPEVPPDAVLPWVRSAKALGVTFHEGVGQPTIDWPAKVAAVEHRLCSLATLPVSAMGRGLACAAYGVSQLMFHAEFGGMPPHQLLRGLTSTIAAFVDSGVAPGQQVGPRFAGVAVDLLVGSPKEGGFGVLPLAQHIRARHAAWGARLACALAQTCPPPWAMVARCALASFPHACHPFAILAWRPLQLERALLPAPFLRLLDGLAALPPVEDVHPDALSPGAWCACAPMWLNPLMPGGAGQVLDVEFADLANSGITTVAELAAAAVAVTQASNREEFLAARAIHLPQNWPAFLDHHRTRQQLHHCVARVSQAWLQAAQNHSPPPASAFHEVALPRLGWRLAQGDRAAGCPVGPPGHPSAAGACAAVATAAPRRLRGPGADTQWQAWGHATRGTGSRGHTPAAKSVAATLGQ